MSTQYTDNELPSALQPLSTPVQDTDQFIVQRAGDNIVRKVTAADVKEYAGAGGGGPIWLGASPLTFVFNPIDGNPITLDCSSLVGAKTVNFLCELVFNYSSATGVIGGEAFFTDTVGLAGNTCAVGALQTKPTPYEAATSFNITGNGMIALDGSGKFYCYISGASVGITTTLIVLVNAYYK